MKTHIEYFYDRVRDTPHEIFLRQPTGEVWMEMTWEQAFQESACMAEHIRTQQLPAGSNIAILSKNCYHWILADLAIMMSGNISVPFFPNVAHDELADLLTRSEAKILFIGKLDEPVWENLKTAVPTTLEVIHFPHYAGNAKITEGKSWDHTVRTCFPIEKPHIPQPTDVWTILFTSGTTGAPKGVMLTYGSPAALMEMERTENIIGVFTGREFVFFSYMPLNHIAERMIVEVASLLTGGSISFSESLERFVHNLQAVQPTVFMSVPRIYTKFQMAVLEKLGEKRFRFLMKVPGVSSFIKKKIRHGFGLGRASIIITGAAPTPQPLKDWYSKIGIELREIYGMTENAGGCCLMPPHEIRPGTVGKPLPQVEIKIEPETGQVLMKAPWLMKGYFKDPEKTAETLRDGWLYTGDKGALTPDGHVLLDGRVSDTFKTAKGKFIDPGPLEWKMSENTLIEQICVTGLGIPQPIALVSLSEIGKSLPRPEVEERLKASLEKLNEGHPGYRHVAKVIVVNDEWTIDNGLLTPTLKIKRNKLNERYGQKFETWYNAGAIVQFENLKI